MALLNLFFNYGLCRQRQATRAGSAINQTS
uniref:Uncharacterized protein n=1 Tax=Arundo donax TaxID=35708 RepID=A0A0A9QA42_ARUDO